MKVFVFVNTTRTERIFHSRESAFFVSQFASEGKIDEGAGEEFLIAEGAVKVCSLHFCRFQAEIS